MNDADRIALLEAHVDELRAGLKQMTSDYAASVRHSIKLERDNKAMFEKMMDYQDRLIELSDVIVRAHDEYDSPDFQPLLRRLRMALRGTY